MTKLLWMVVAAGCGTVANKPPAPDAPPVDAAVEIDAPVTSTICDPTAPFDPPVKVAGMSSMGTEGTSRLSPDELTVYYSGLIGSVPHSEIYIAHRASLDAPFGTSTDQLALDTAGGEVDPTIMADQLTIVYAASPTSSEGTHIFVAGRSSTLASFGAPTLLAGVASPVKTDTDIQPFLTADGLELWFTSTRAGGLGGFDIWRSTRVGDAFAAPTLEAALSSTADEWLPAVSADRLTVYLASKRAGGMGDFDIWTSHRTTISDEFPAPTPVVELNTTGYEVPTWLSGDNCRLYFNSSRAGNEDLFVAVRHP